MSEVVAFTAKIILKSVPDTRDTQLTLASLINENVSFVTHEECFDGPMEFFFWQGEKLILRCKRCGLNRAVRAYQDDPNRLTITKFFLDQESDTLVLDDSGGKVVLKKVEKQQVAAVPADSARSEPRPWWRFWG